MNCPTEVEFEFFRKAGNAFLSRPSLGQYKTKYLSAFKCQRARLATLGRPGPVCPSLRCSWEPAAPSFKTSPHSERSRGHRRRPLDGLLPPRGRYDKGQRTGPSDSQNWGREGENLPFLTLNVMFFALQ